MAVQDLVDNNLKSESKGGNFTYMKARRMILKSGLEHEPEKTLALRLRSVDYRRSDLYAVDVDSKGARLETLPIDLHGYDFCPFKTFSVLRDPTHDEFRRKARNNGSVNLLCVSNCDLDIKLKRTSADGTWNEQRQCFVLPLTEKATLPYFDAALELSMPGSKSPVRAHVQLWPAFLRGVLIVRFHKAPLLPGWTTLALRRDMYRSTFTPHSGGFLVGRAFTYKQPLARDDFLFLEFEYMRPLVLFIHSLRRIGLFFAYLVLLALILTLGLLVTTIYGLIQGAPIWMPWFTIMGILYHFNKISLTILLAVPFGMLGVSNVILMLLVLLGAPFLLVPIDGPEEAGEVLERCRAVLDNTDWNWESWATFFTSTDWNLRGLVRMTKETTGIVYPVAREAVTVAVKLSWPVIRWYMSGFT
ncbi:hypothetical protein BST61_g9594 [Cercospora zeina]